MKARRAWMPVLVAGVVEVMMVVTVTLTSQDVYAVRGLLQGRKYLLLVQYLRDAHSLSLGDARNLMVMLRAAHDTGNVLSKAELTEVLWVLPDAHLPTPTAR